MTWIALAIALACYLGTVFFIASNDGRVGGLALLVLSVAFVGGGSVGLGALSQWEIARASAGDTSEAGISAWLASVFFGLAVLGFSAMAPSVAGLSMVVRGRRPAWVDGLLALRTWEKGLICCGAPMAIGAAAFLLLVVG